MTVNMSGSGIHQYISRASPSARTQKLVRNLAEILLRLHRQPALFHLGHKCAKLLDLLFRLERPLESSVRSPLEQLLGITAPIARDSLDERFLVAEVQEDLYYVAQEGLRVKLEFLSVPDLQISVFRSNEGVQIVVQHGGETIHDFWHHERRLGLSGEDFEKLDG
jgi:hypothetical protein